MSIQTIDEIAVFRLSNEENSKIALIYLLTDKFSGYFPDLALIHKKILLFLR